MKLMKQKLAVLLSCSLVLATTLGGFAYQADSATDEPPIPSALQTPEQLQQLVAPIALYPDALVAQILAASTYPDQIVVADRWMQQHSGLTGDSLAQEVNKQAWDPSVQALTQFPSVLANMDKNLSWTSGLGDAYINQQQDVLDAVQVMRRRAQRAGHLESTPQQTVTTEGQTIVIQSPNPDVVYVPEFDPWSVYGSPIPVYPYWDPYPGLFIGGPGISFGLGFGIGYFGGFGWGWNHWGFDWRRHHVIYNRHDYTSHSRTFIDRHSRRGGTSFNHNGGFRGGSSATNSAFRGSRISGSPRSRPTAPLFRGPATSPSSPAYHPSAFSGFNHGGIAQGYSYRGQSSFGGGFRGGGGFPSAGGFRGGVGGGGFRGGGGARGGGGHR